MPPGSRRRRDVPPSPPRALSAYQHTPRHITPTSYTDRPTTTQTRHVVELKFHGCSFLVWYHCDILANTSRGNLACRTRMLRESSPECRSCRACYEDATKKLLPWNSRFIHAVQSSAELTRRKLYYTVSQKVSQFQVATSFSLHVTSVPTLPGNT